MKDEGFLDEIEKIVDEVWDSEKKQINTHVDSHEKDFNIWMEKALEHKVEDYQREYLREIQRRNMWDSPYSRQYMGEFQTRPTRTLKHRCECSTNMVVTYLDNREEYRAVNYYGSDAGRPVEMRRQEYDHFHCPRCRQQIRVVGKVLEITIDMTE